jgi:hypothetical protein
MRRIVRGVSRGIYWYGLLVAILSGARAWVGRKECDDLHAPLPARQTLVAESHRVHNWLGNKPWRRDIFVTDGWRTRNLLARKFVTDLTWNEDT